MNRGMPSDHRKIKMTLSLFDDDNNTDNDNFEQEGSHGDYNSDDFNDNQEEENDDDSQGDDNQEEDDVFDDYDRGAEITKIDDQNDDRSESEKLFVKKYEILGKIGQGTYGKVYRGRERETGKYVAIKKSYIENPREEGIPACTLREISNLKILNRSEEHIVRLLSVECIEKKLAVGGWVVYLVFEYMDCDLVQVYRDHLCRKEPISPIKIKSYMYQLLKGLEHCHKNGILHRDLKPSNLLVSESTGLLKIGDWGLGRVVFGPKSCFSNIHGTLWYTAPEQLLGDPQQTFAIDVWAVGCIFGEMHTLRPIFEGDKEIEVLMKIFKKLGTPDDSVWAGVSKLENWSDEFPHWNRSDDLRESLVNIDDRGFDLLLKMLDYQPSKRISAKHALSHPYFAEYCESYDSDSAESESPESYS